MMLWKYGSDFKQMLRKYEWYKGFDPLLILGYTSDKCQQHTLLVKLPQPQPWQSSLENQIVQHSLIQEDVAVMAEPDTVLGSISSAALGPSAGTPQLPEPPPALGTALSQSPSEFFPPEM